MNKLSIPLIALSLAGNCMALTPASDDFTSTKLSSQWYQYKTGKGLLTPQNGALSFVAKGKGTPNDFASIELLDSYPGVSENWEMIVELSSIAKLKKNAGVGFMIFNSADRKDYLFVEFYGPSGIEAGVLQDGKPKKKRLSLKVGPQKGAIRVRYNKNTKLLTFSASLKTGLEGYDFKSIGTFSPTGKGGKVSANWKMKADGSFGIQLFGHGESTKVAAGNTTLDNFVLRTY